jgi:hypothetical protein
MRIPPRTPSSSAVEARVVVVVVVDVDVDMELDADAETEAEADGIGEHGPPKVRSTPLRVPPRQPALVAERDASAERRGARWKYLPHVSPPLRLRLQAASAPVPRHALLVRAMRKRIEVPRRAEVELELEDLERAAVRAQVVVVQERVRERGEARGERG